jgi:hypothetical protein
VIIFFFFIFYNYSFIESQKYCNYIVKQKLWSFYLPNEADFLESIFDSQNIIIFEKSPWKIIITKYGGRVLSVDNGSGNLLWIHPNIDSIVKKRHWNLGGIRTWVAPEQSFFYENPKDFTSWFCPIGIDPANYTLEKKNEQSVRLTTDIKAKDQLQGVVFQGQLAKKITIVKAASTHLFDKLAIKISSELIVQDFPFPFSLWSIVQVPIGSKGFGQLIIPMKEIIQPIDYFGTLSESNYKAEFDAIQFFLTGKKEFKIGIKPEDLPNNTIVRMNYSFFHGSKQNAIFIMSKSAAANQEDCVDIAKSGVQEKAVIQSYNSDQNKTDLQYAELEIQGKRAKKMPNRQFLANEEYVISFSCEK